uniref:Heparan-alpha-glucosaminide N-acetyltransferase n=1 Tax=Oryzias latipes TaxID=8090 RepID=A0A3P9HBB6_ORYLA
MSKQGRKKEIDVHYGKKGAKEKHKTHSSRLSRRSKVAVSICCWISADLCSVSFLTPVALHHRKHLALKMDEALLTVSNELNSSVLVSWKSERCYQVITLQVFYLPVIFPCHRRTFTASFTVKTQHAVTLQLNNTSNNNELCNVQFHFGEHGNYSLWIKNPNGSAQVNCSVVTDAVPVNSYIREFSTSLNLDRMINVKAFGGCDVHEMFLLTAILVAFFVFVGLALIIALVIMVFVNYGGGRYWFFRHESWNGLTVADLVFPWFVFIMGTSIALSINSLLRAGLTRGSLLRKIVWRSIQLFLIGVFIINPNYCQGALSWENLRIPGVLQRLAFSYLVVASLDLMVARGHLDVLQTDAWWSPFLDVLLYWPAWVVVLLLEVLWLSLTFLLPVPDCPTGYLGPGGIGDMGLYANCTGGAAAFLDRWLLGEKHIYQTPSSRVLYLTQIPYDPEGVLGSINSVLMAFLGLQAGKIILHYRDLPTSIMSRFLIWGLFMGVISAVLTRCSTDQGFIPVNKNLWSLSYVTTLACFAFVLLVLVYYTVDVKKWWSGSPFYYPGMNSILVYVGHEVFEDYFPFRWRMVDSQSHTEHLIQNLFATCCWIFISYILYRKKIFWKI